VFPTVFVSLHPDYVLIHRIQPVTESETKVTCEFLFSAESIENSEFDPRSAVTFWDQTNLQDWQVCELTQQGMSTDGYEPGLYSGLESMVAAFDKYYLRQLQGKNL
jgi:Rieske 2Fe-2S family protein